MSAWHGLVRPSLATLIALTIITGGLYPAAVTVVARVAFPEQAAGTLIVTADGRAIGSLLIGQSFADPRYLWPRPSAAGSGYDGAASGGSNLGPTSRVLIERVAAEVDRLRADPGLGPIPVDLVTTSASGLDPHVSPAGAELQVARIAAARGVGEDVVRSAIERHTEGRLLGFLGQPRVNVLAVNLDLDGLLR